MAALKPMSRPLAETAHTLLARLGVPPARFTGGNYATITLLYDWMFGTLDYGTGPRKAARIKA